MLDPVGNLYVADSVNNRIQFVAKSTCSSSCPWGLASTTANFVYTIAGSASGTAGNSGNGGLATSALLSTPIYVSLDAAGDLYVSDTSNNRIQEVAKISGTQWSQTMTANNVYTVAGSAAGTGGSSGNGGPGTSALINNPGQMVVDAAGDLFIPEEVNSWVREIAAGTGVSASAYTIAGTSTAGAAGDGGPATSAQFNTPVGGAVDSSGNVYVADMANNRIQEVAGVTGTQWGIAMAAGNVYTVAGSATGTAGNSGNGGVATSALLNGPNDVALDSAGNLYIGDSVNNRVQFVAKATCASSCPWGLSATTAGYVYTIAGSASGTAGNTGNGGLATSALLSAPRGLTFDTAGNLYIADKANNRVQFVAKGSCSVACPWGLSSTTANYIYTIAGSATGTAGNTGNGGLATSALLNAPKGIALDPSGNLYVADQVNNRIQFVAKTSCAASCRWGLSSTTANAVYTIAGSATGTAGNSGNGGLATSALLNTPIYVAFDRSGDLYISDTANNRIQEVANVSATQWGQAMSVNDIYTVAGSAAGTAGSSGNGGPATSALLNNPGAVVVDAAGDLVIPEEANNWVREVVHPLPPDLLTHYSYTTVGSTAHVLNGLTDTLGSTSGFSYTGTGCPASAPACLTSMTDALGRTTSWSYSLDANGNGTVLATDPLGTKTQYAVSSYQITSETDGYQTLAAATTTWVFYPNTSGAWVIQDPNGNVTSYFFDASGNQTERVDPLNRTTSYTYDSLNDQLSKTTPAGATTTYTYDSKGNVLTSVFPSPTGTGTSTTTNTYGDSVHPGLVTAVRDANSHTTTYAYDSYGYENSVTDAMATGDQTTLTYDDATGQKLTMVSPRGNASGATPAAFTTSYAYNWFGNETQTTDPLGDVTQATFDGGSNKLSATDPRGNTTSYVYDADHELTRVVAPDGTSASAAFDADGRTTATIDGIGQLTAGSFDVFGNLIQVTDPLGHTKSATFDGARNRLTTTDGLGNTTRYTYDGDNEPVLTTQPDGTTRTFAYDADGNRTSSIDGAGNTTSYAYLHLAKDQLSSTTDPRSKTWSETYDAVGNHVTEVNPDSKTTTWSYDNANRITGVSYSDGTTHSVSYGYNQDSLATSMVDASGTSNYGYDNADRLTSYQNGAGTTISYGYDKASEVTSITYPGTSHTVTNGYDSWGRMSSVTDWNSNKTQFAYDGQSNLTSITYPNGVTSSSGYDAASQLSSIADSSGSTLASFSYSRDNAGSITSETDTGTPGAGTTSYSYNSLHEITAAGTSSFTYNAGMNLTTSPSGIPQAFNADDQICYSGTGTGTCASPPTGATTYGYSNEGNRTAKTPASGTTYAYAYDQANDLTGYTPSVGQAATYTYDGNGLLQSENAGSPTNFSWSVQGKLPLLLSDGTNYYLYGPGTAPIEQVNVSSGTATYLLSDHLGSIRAITNASGSLTGGVTYDAWGNTTGTSGTATSPFGFSGAYKDAASGLYYMRARWYDPGTGQFMSLDPKVATTLNPYQYAGNNPMNNTDPSGLDLVADYLQAMYLQSQQNIAYGELLTNLFIGDTVGAFLDSLWLNQLATEVFLNALQTQADVAASEFYAAVSASAPAPAPGPLPAPPPPAPPAVTSTNPCTHVPVDQAACDYAAGSPQAGLALQEGCGTSCFHGPPPPAPGANPVGAVVSAISSGVSTAWCVVKQFNPLGPEGGGSLILEGLSGISISAGGVVTAIGVGPPGWVAVPAGAAGIAGGSYILSQGIQQVEQAC